MEYCSEISKNNKNINISFCLPVYNVKIYIKECIESIINQTFNEIEYEILCIDDVSTDGTYEYLCELGQVFPQIRIVRNDKNHGVSYTRNALINLAKGRYIWFVDPDDMIYPNIVSYMYQIIKIEDADVILGNYLCIPETFTEELKRIDYIHWEYTPIISLPKDKNGVIMSAVWAGMFKKSFLIENRIQFNENMIAQEDTLFYYELSIRKPRVIKCEETCYLYRQRENSIMHRRGEERAKKYYISMLSMLDTYIDHYTNNTYTDKDVILSKIHHSKQNVASCLSSVTNTKYVKEELKKLKKKGIYPYPFRKEALHSKMNFIRRMIDFLLPIEPFFWCSHLLYKIYSRKHYED